MWLLWGKLWQQVLHWLGRGVFSREGPQMALGPSCSFKHICGGQFFWLWAISCCFWKLSCLVKEGQCNSSGVYKLSGRLSLSDITQVGSQPDYVEQQTTPLIKCDACSWCVEHWSGFALQRFFTLHGVVTQSQNSLPAVGQVWSGVRRSVCIMRWIIFSMKRGRGHRVSPHPWLNVLLYVFLPLNLRERWLSLILIASYWPNRPWMVFLACLLHNQQWPLPLWLNPKRVEGLSVTET